MKTAVSIPDEIFRGAEHFARQTQRSRSRLFSDALSEYLLRHAPEELTEAMNRACRALQDAGPRPAGRRPKPPSRSERDTFAAVASALILEQSEW